jgi:hypothetical protein
MPMPSGWHPASLVRDTNSGQHAGELDREHRRANPFGRPRSDAASMHNPGMPQSAPGGTLGYYLK